MVLGLAVLVMGLMLWPRSPTLLAQGNHLAESRLIEQWQAGELVVLVRHAERCDQSNNPCLGPPDGITRVGELASADVGKALSLLGMERTDVLTSPTTRTVQTAHSMFSREVTQQEWLAACGNTLRDEVVAHKSARRNLVLVTHSGCIDQLERQLGVPGGQRSSDYAQAVFVSVGANGTPRILGRMNAPEWRKLLARRAP